VGDVLFVDKHDERIRFTSPVSGQVKAIVRGEKRRLEAVVVEEDQASKPAVFDIPRNAEEIKALMLRCGLWAMLRQRPFGVVANPDDQPKAIFVSAFDSAPLAPDYDFVLQDREEWFKKGLEALAKLTGKPVHVCFRSEKGHVFEGGHTGPSLRIHYVKGPHPAGNIGTQIAHIDPINKGEVVWTMNAQDVALLGELVSAGTYRPEKIIAVAGPQIKNPHYYRIKAGAFLASLVAEQVLNPNYPKIESATPSEENRIISGNILSGTRIAADGFIGAYDSLISIIPEGDYYDFMGWLMPGFKKYSFSRTFFSGFLPKNGFKPFGFRIPRFSSYWNFDTNTHGDERPLVFTGNFERVFPFDIYPTQLIKACIVGDIDLMEQLGIYEVEPEDFALCEFIDVSKTEIQSIVRESLEKIRKEALG
jgi:Na+-transporting NADH:ubiquinone oxidoreductase subunit A